MKFFLLPFYFFCISSAFSQSADSTVYNPPNALKEGMYLNFLDFRRNLPLPKEYISCKTNKEQMDFYGKLIDEQIATANVASGSFTFSPGRCWGFYQNNTLYINYEGMFYRVPVFGSICYLIASVNVVTYGAGYYDPMFGMTMGGAPIRTKELRNFIMSFYSGKMEEFTTQRAELLLSNDKDLFEEYSKLSRRKKQDQIYRFIKRYNDLHPIYFLN
ncbi:MAG: hypothetical protein JSU07_05725 [Bacteroidetes bacterium]|nr:hypothetical protein [Bacteroidota bacterium]